MTGAANHARRDKQLSQPDPVRRPGATPAPDEETGPLEELMAMHATAGNEAVGRWLRREQVPFAPTTPGIPTEAGPRLAAAPKVPAKKGAGGKAAAASGAAPAVTITDDLRRKFAATVLAEAYDGEELAIAWIYYNRVVVAGQGEAGLQASSAYAGKGPWYKVWMVALGDTAFATEKSKARDVSDYPTIADYVHKHGWFREVGQPRADTWSDVLDRLHKDPSVSPYQGWEGQGSLEDFNLDRGKWRKARQYYWLQEAGQVTERHVKILERSVIFNERAIESFFAKNPDKLPKSVKKYHP
jgi:hypothetical protein